MRSFSGRTLYRLATMGIGMCLAAGSQGALAAPGAGQLFGTDANGGSLLEVSTATGVGSPVGFLGIGPAPSLAIDPTTGTMYTASGGGAPTLHTVDPGSGMTTPVGDTGLGFAAVGGMDFDAAGTLYAAVNIAGDGGTGSDHLAILDKTNGSATIIGPFGTCTPDVTVPSTGAGSCDNEGMEGIAFDAAGTLWGVHSQRGAAGAPGLYTIDTGSGAATFVAPILDVAGTPPSGGLVSIQYACDGTLYGGTGRFLAPASDDGGFLVTVDPGTGAFAFVGGVSATPGSSLGGLAFETGCAPVVPATTDSALRTLLPLLLLMIAITVATAGTLRGVRRSS